MSRPTKNVTGERFGRLIAVKLGGFRIYGRQRHRFAIWQCVCDCGKTVSVQLADLSSGHTRSCGCLRTELRGTAQRTHGESRGRHITPEYRTWRGIIDRTTNPKSSGFKNYGGRGIVVCGEWLHSYETFLADMGRRPSPAHSTERKNNNEGYSKSNCIWATRIDQARNKRSNVLLTLNGETMTAVQWARRLGFRRTLIYVRKDRGWTDEEILTTPPLPAIQQAA